MSVFISSIPNAQEDDLLLAKKITKGELDISKREWFLKIFYPKCLKIVRYFSSIEVETLSM